MDWLDLLAVQGTLESSATPQFKTINSLVLSFLYSPTLILLLQSSGVTLGCLSPDNALYAPALLCMHPSHGVWGRFFCPALHLDCAAAASFLLSAGNCWGFCFGFSGSSPLSQILFSLDSGHGFWDFCQNQDGSVCCSPQNSLVLKT